MKECIDCAEKITTTFDWGIFIFFSVYVMFFIYLIYLNEKATKE